MGVGENCVRDSIMIAIQAIKYRRYQAPQWQPLQLASVDKNKRCHTILVLSIELARCHEALFPN